METDYPVFLAFVQTEPGRLNFPGNLRHVGHSPRHDDVIRLRKPGLDFFPEMPVALPEQIVPELVIQMLRR